MKEVTVGMNVALNNRVYDANNGPPYLATVVELPSNLTLLSTIIISWLNPERASHKSRWLKYFKPSSQLNHYSFTSRCYTV